MGNDVRITLIATGFTAKTDTASREDEATKRLKEIKTEEELDVPSFLRKSRPMFNRQAIPQEKISNRPQRIFNP